MNGMNRFGTKSDRDIEDCPFREICTGMVEISCRPGVRKLMRRAISLCSPRSRCFALFCELREKEGYAHVAQGCDGAE